MVDALNLTDSIPSLSKNKAEDVIDSMAKAKWLHIEKEGNSVFIYLGVRTFLELRSWLEEIYSLAECVMCSEPVIRVRTTNFSSFLNRSLGNIMSKQKVSRSRSYTLQ